MKQDEAGAGGSIAPGAAGFLQIGFGRGGGAPVDDGAHIGFVDTHPEGDGGHENGDLVVQEGILQAFALVGREPGVIVGGGVALSAQFASEPFGFLAGAAVDDGGEMGAAAQKVEQSGHTFLHRLADAGDVGAVGGEDDAVI